MIRTTLSLALCSALSAATAALAQDVVAPVSDPAVRALDPGITALVIDRRLQPTLMRVTDIEDGRVVGLNRHGSSVTFEAGALVALVRSSPLVDISQGVGVTHTPGEPSLELLRLRLEAATRGVLTTTDGRRYVGALDASAERAVQGETLTWLESDAARTLAYEAIAHFVRADAPPSVRYTLPAEVTSDTLLLGNGDALEGFVAEVGHAVVFEDLDGNVLELDLTRLYAIVFANPSLEPSGVRIWLDDGSVHAGTDLMMTAGGDPTLTEADADAEVVIPVERIRSIVFDAARLLALSALDPTRVRTEGAGEPIVERTHADDLLLDRSPSLNAKDLVLTGPMSATYRLPPTAERFACTVSLLRPGSVWADCTLVVRVDGEEVGRYALDRAQARRPINIVLPGTAERTEPIELRLDLEEGRFGPVHDRVRMARPIVLLGAPRSG